MEEFKINNNLSFEDDETKIEYQKYLDEINEYNKKIANGETPEKDLSEIADEFKLKFKINNKTNSTDNTNNAINDKDEFDELVKKLNDNLNIQSEKKSIDEQIEDINNRIADLEKIENDSISFVPDSLKGYILFDNDGYAFANQKIPVELEIEYDNFINKYYNSENNIIVNNIVNKIIELPYNVETTIAQLIDYNPEVAFVSPLTQGIISNIVVNKCEGRGIKLDENRDEFGGLAYYNKFKKL